MTISQQLVQVSVDSSFKDSLERTMEVMKGPKHKLHPCRYSCGYKTNKLDRLDRHEKCHEIQSDYQCHMCTFSTDRRRDINGHLRHVHRQSEEDVEAFHISRLEVFKEPSMSEEPACDSSTDQGTMNQRSLRKRRASSASQSKESDRKVAKVVASAADQQQRKRRASIAGHSNKESDQNLAKVAEPSGADHLDEEPKGEDKMTRPSWAKLIRRKVYLCPRPLCGFWAQRVCHFHDHLVSKHRTAPGFKCSDCPMKAVTRTTIYAHIYGHRRPSSGKKASHLQAGSECTVPVPLDRYEAHLRTLAVPTGKTRGELGDEELKLHEEEKEREKEVESLEASIAEGFRSIQDIAKDSEDKVKELKEKEKLVVSTEASLVHQKHQLVKKMAKLRGETLEAAKDEEAALTKELEKGARLKGVIAHRMSTAKTESEALVTEKKAELRAKILANSESKRKLDEIRVQSLTSALQSERFQQEAKWLSQLDS